MEYTDTIYDQEINDSEIEVGRVLDDGDYENRFVDYDANKVFNGVKLSEILSKEEVVDEKYLLDPEEHFDINSSPK